MRITAISNNIIQDIDLFILRGFISLPPRNTILKQKSLTDISNKGNMVMKGKKLRNKFEGKMFSNVLWMHNQKLL